MNWRPPRFPSRPRTAAAAIMVASAGLAHGQALPPPPDEGPIIIGENVGKYNWWDLQWLRTEFEFYGEFRRDRQTSEGQPTLTVHDDLLRFTNNLAFQSYIGHKNLIDLTGSFKLGVEDQKITSSAADSDIHETPFTDFYDLQALILGNSKTPVTLYSRRDETLTAREFIGSFRTDTTEHGAILTLQSELFPSRFQYFHREQNQSDPTGSLDYSVVQDTFSLQSQTRLTDQQRLDLNYTFDQVDEEQSSSRNDVYGRHDGTLTHYWNFGKENRDSLRSSLRFFDRSGRSDQGILRLDEQMVLNHSDRLESRYNLAVERQERGGSEQRLVSGNATVRHKLFDSLVSSATAGGSSFEIPGEFTSTDLFTSGSLDYTKKVPLGRLAASAGVGVNHQDNGDRGANIFIVNEVHTFNDPFNLVISRRNIIPGSIQITDVTQLQTYSVNLDYQIIASNARVELVRVPTGAIVNGQAVLITYQIGPEPGSQIDTTTQNYSVRYSIEEGFLAGLALYALHQRTDQSIDTVDASLFVLDEISDFRYGAEYRIGDFTFLGEMQNHDSTVSPFDRWRVEGRMDRRMSRNGTLSIELVHDVIDYRGIDNHVELDRAQTRWTERVRTGLDLSAYLQYRDERDDRNGDVRGFEQAVEVHWYFRQTKVFGSIRNSILEGDRSDRTSQLFTVGVTRSF